MSPDIVGVCYKMFNYQKNNKKESFFLLWTVYCLLSTFFIGCATVATKNSLPVYSIKGVPYFSLAELCRQKGISWDYDTFTRTVRLSRDSHKISLMAGEPLVVVDGVPKHLKHPVRLYKGAIVVPSKFKSDIFDSVFGEMPLPLETKEGLLGIKRVVIDPGHGGSDPGAIGRKTGLKEKEVNLDIAERLAGLLRDEGIEVIMTRSSDDSVSLAKRVDIANKSAVDIFVSIHANANRVKHLNGFEVYYLSSAVRCSNRAEAIELSHAICAAAKSELETRIIGIKPASFCVLRAVSVPAVLVEVGFLSNDKEEGSLRGIYYRQQLAKKIAAGIKNYGRRSVLAGVTK